MARGACSGEPAFVPTGRRVETGCRTDEHIPARALSPRTPTGDDRVDMPVLEARPRGPAAALRGMLDGRHRPRVFFAGRSCRLRRSSRRWRSCSGLLVVDVVLTVRIGRADERRSTRGAPARTGDRTDCLVGSTIGGGARCCRSWSALIGIVAAMLRQWRIAAFCVVRARGRGRDLPRRHDRRAPRPADTSRGSTTCRRTRATRPATRPRRSPSTAASRCCSRRRSRRAAGASLPGRSRVLLPVVRRRSRACIAACTIRSTSAAGALLGIGAVIDRSSRAAPPAASRAARSGRARSLATTAARHDRRGRARGKTLGGGLPELRRVLAGAGVESRSGTRCPRAGRRRSRSSGRSTPGPTSSSSGAATGWCSAAVDVARGHRRARSRSCPPGTANLFASNLGIPTRPRAGGADRAARARRAASTSGASTASASP